MRTFLLALVALSGAASQDEKRPNILLILADDMGWGDVRSHGNEKIETPVLDRLAAEGARFDRFFVSPVCAPTRASLLTGRWSLRTGVSWVTRGLETMRAEEVTLAEALRGAGYATGAFGKWHNGAHHPFHPNAQGFDQFLGFCAGHWNNYFDTTLEENGRPAPTKGFITDVLTDAALAFIDKNRERPFFCYVPFNAPHGPFQAPDRFFDRCRARGLDPQTAAIYGMVENVDENVGRLLRKLDDLKLAERTVVLFLTDNGPNSDRFNGGLRGRKGSVHEGGIRVPLFVRWPGRIRPGIAVKEIAAHVDLFPTLLDLAGVPAPRGPALDGASLAPLLLGDGNEWPDRKLFTHQSRGGEVEPVPGSVRTRRWRLVNDGRKWELFDMEADPGEKADAAERHPAIAADLRKAYEDWFRDVTARPVERLPIPVGLEAAPEVELPAPEAYLKGAVRWMGKSGWANDWITNWTGLDDQVRWEIDVARAGRYEVTLLYTAREAGARVRLEAGGRSLEGAVEKAHDPAPLPSPDRVPRGEVYEKEWATLPLGALDLEAGRASFQLRALARPGASVMDLKAVRVRRVE
jgi:arylsulfatase A